MATRRKQVESEKPRRPPATTPEARENQMISKAVDLAEKQITEGTASAQVLTHFLKLGSSRERLEQEKIRIETELAGAKKEAMAAHGRIEELYDAAITAMRSYAGGPAPEPKEDDDYDD